MDRYYDVSCRAKVSASESSSSFRLLHDRSRSNGTACILRNSVHIEGDRRECVQFVAQADVRVGVRLTLDNTR
jgi:hypothetical protein